jgi:hypothetical protein
LNQCYNLVRMCRDCGPVECCVTGGVVV